MTGSQPEWNKIPLSDISIARLIGRGTRSCDTCKTVKKSSKRPDATSWQGGVRRNNATDLASNLSIWNSFSCCQLPAASRAATGPSPETAGSRPGERPHPVGSHCQCINRVRCREPAGDQHRDPSKDRRTGHQRTTSVGQARRGPATVGPNNGIVPPTTGTHRVRAAMGDRGGTSDPAVGSGRGSGGGLR